MVLRPVEIAEAESLAASIRRATTREHARLEQKVDLDAGWDRRRYVAFLRATLTVVQPLDVPVQFHLGALHFPLLATSAVRLRDDLAALGADASVTGGAAAPVIASRADAFGAAYVLLGSLLGGRVIAHALHAQLPLAPSQVTYLAPDADVRAAWRQFMSELNAWGAQASPAARAAAVDTALSLFAAFDRAFDAEGFR